MSIRTIEQKMSADTLWDGSPPAGGLDRAIVHHAADDVVKATKTWTFVNGAFVAGDVGKLLLMGGTASGNDGIFTIAQVNSPTEIETAEDPGADETAGGSPWTQNVYDGSASPVLANDMESSPESVVGGLFDFENEDPILLKQIMVKFGSGTTSWTVSVVDVDSVETPIASVSSAAALFSTDSVGPLAGLILLQGQKLKLESVGGPTTASVARVTTSRQIHG